MLGKVKDKDKTDDLTEFVGCLLKMKPEEFLGVAKLSGVAIAEEDAKPRDAEIVFREICTQFTVWNRVQRRDMLKICRQTVKGRPFPSEAKKDAQEVSDGPTTEDN